MKVLVLFDIDGTLVSGGPARHAFHAAMLDAFGTTGAIESHDFAGKTDPQIARELLRGAGLEDEAVDEGLPTLWRRYLEELEARLPDDPMRALPGVAELVDALAEEVDVGLGLVTGNIVEGARLKLGSARLAGPFLDAPGGAVGAFGSDHEVRNHLPALALRRAREVWGVELAPDAAVVVGDTPADVACGRHGGTRTLAVATGSHSAEALAEAGADQVVADLSDTERMLEILLGRG